MKRYFFFLFVGVALGLWAFSHFKPQDRAVGPVAPHVEPGVLESTPQAQAPIKHASPLERPSPLSRFLEDTLAELPEIRSVEAEEDLTHGPPRAVFLVAQRLGEIRERLSTSPESVAEVERFYDRCAQNEAVLLSVRALCLRNLMDLKSQWRDGSPVQTDRYPLVVRRIADRLPVLPFRFGR